MQSDAKAIESTTTLSAPSEHEPSSLAGNHVREREIKIVAVTVGKETYRVDIDRVQTVILPQPITKIPRMAPHVCGVINLRGRVVPILDLRARFSLTPDALNNRSQSRIVMVDVDGEHVGMSVDGVSEVLRINESAVVPPPQGLETEGFVSAVVRAPSLQVGGADRLILMLDLHNTVHNDGGFQIGRPPADRPALAA